MSGLRESTNGGGKILVVDDETSIVDDEGRLVAKVTQTQAVLRAA